MVTDTIFTYLLCDKNSLAQYAEGELVSFSKLKSNLFIVYRSQNTSVPDHYYNLKLEDEFSGIKTITDIIFKGLREISLVNLDISNNRVYVRKDSFGNWQKIITHLPPLLIQSIKIYDFRQPTSKEFPILKNYYDELLNNNFKYTALPYPEIKELEYFRNEKKGFHDLHMHLNGSIETDVVWQDFLKAPFSIYKELQNSFKNPKVVEQFEQESHLLNPYKFYKLLLSARKLRQLFFNIIFEINVDILKSLSFEKLVHQVLYADDYQVGHQNYKHPFSIVLIGQNKKSNELALEALMYILLFQELEKNKSESLASLFHFYLLIKGLSNRLLVQQEHQFGFEQFQKHTFNNLRDLSEKTYHQRFFQMHGNETKNLSFLEGRFAPKDSALKNSILLNSIDRGWKVFNPDIAVKGIYPNTLSYKPELKLIAHFIKQKENNKSKSIRHKSLRKDLHKKGRVLTYLLNKSHYKNLVVGIDAAANELDTPPEVFGPLFRKIRRAGMIKHFTYHAGEDFFHVLSGLRAIFEAIEFTDLKKNDRIGHATATGITIALWAKAVGENIPIKRGEWLDNLIFTIYIIEKLNVTKLNPKLNELKISAAFHFEEIYDREFNYTDYENSWFFRKHCPIIAFSKDYDDARLHELFDYDEWRKITDIKSNAASFALYNSYHLLGIRRKYDHVIEISPLEILNCIELKEIQLAILKYMATRKIVIETLPTSNVRISHYKDHSEHHLFNWKKWKEEGFEIPKIIVGSDDTGIFATNIFNEYAHIYCQLTAQSNNDTLMAEKAIKFLEELNKNSEEFRFN